MNFMEDKTDYIWGTLFSKKGLQMTNEEQKEFIKNVLIKIANEEQKKGLNMLCNMIYETMVKAKKYY